MQKKIRLIASDLDGTLLRSDGSISEYTVNTIREAQKRGIVFAACSGRYPENADAVLKKYGIRCPICGNNGATIWDAESDSVLRDLTIDREAAREVAEVAREAGVHFLIYARKAVCGSSEKALQVTQGRFAGVLEREYGVRYSYGAEAIGQALDRPINKFYLFDYERMDAESRKRLMERLRSVGKMTVTTSGLRNVEVIPFGCSKADGAAALARLFGIGMENVMTVGDYENDIPMLSAAGCGVAMGNASEKVKKQADAVTASNDADGLAGAILKYAL